MKNVTISMDEETLALVRIKAAEAGKSVSAYLSAIAAERVQINTTRQLASLAEFLDGPGLPGAASAWPGREALYDEESDELLHRHQPADVRSRSARSGEAERRGGFAEGNHQAGYAGPQPTEPE